MIAESNVIVRDLEFNREANLALLVDKKELGLNGVVCDFRLFSLTQMINARMPRMFHFAVKEFEALSQISKCSLQP